MRPRRRPAPLLPWLLLPALLAATALVQHAMGRLTLCACGRVRLWSGNVWSAENSQQLTDWYSLSHLVHGLLFYALLAWAAPRWPRAWRAVAALAIEAAWEIAENTPWVIDRYRAATVSLDYVGDSLLNSAGDQLAMLLGFWLAARLPVPAAIALGLGLELLALVMIRDNLALNVLMLLWPLAAIRDWQAAGAPLP